MERITQVWIDAIPLHVPMLPLDELATRARRHGDKTGVVGLSLQQLEHDYLHTTMLASPVLPNARLRTSWSDRLRARWEARMEHAINGCYPHLACPAESPQVRSAQRRSVRPMTGVPALTVLST